ncbi:hypothetical protein FRX31_013195, partial [Thalictrum thalictroides]
SSLSFVSSMLFELFSLSVTSLLLISTSLPCFVLLVVGSMSVSLPLPFLLIWFGSSSSSFSSISIIFWISSSTTFAIPFSTSKQVNLLLDTIAMLRVCCVFCLGACFHVLFIPYLPPFIVSPPLFILFPLLLLLCIPLLPGWICFHASSPLFSCCCPSTDFFLQLLSV